MLRPFHFISFFVCITLLYSLALGVHAVIAGSHHMKLYEVKALVLTRCTMG